MMKRKGSSVHEVSLGHGGLKTKLELQDGSQLYSYLLATFSSLNSFGGPLPILNLLAFT